MGKNTKRRSQSQVIRDRRKIAQMYLAGHYQEEIAEELGIDQSTVSRDLKHLSIQWQQESEQDIRQVKAELIQRYRFLYGEAYQAWLLSLQDAVTEESGSTARGPYAKTKRVGQSGNPGLLAQAQAALGAIREMLGTDAPKKVEITDWRDELTRKVLSGEWTVAQAIKVINDSDLAREWLESSGLQFAGVREATPASVEVE